jgi:cytochrome c553
LFGKGAEMPHFGKKLTDDQIRQLSDLIASQRHAKGEG